MSKKEITFPKFKNESEEADWWASPEGRSYTRQQGAKQRREDPHRKGKIAAMLQNANLNTQISIRLPDSDLDNARAVAKRKGIPYQTYIKMVLHEALSKEPSV